VPDYYSSYGVVLAVVAAGAILVGVAFGAARLIAPHRPHRDKLTTYECGIDPVGEGWSQSQIRYYVFGFLFVIFDVESFIAILGAGLLYAWRKGVLRWV
jgi:NADH-quinone oxidoreductase subunit A